VSLIDTGWDIRGCLCNCGFRFLYLLVCEIGGDSVDLNVICFSCEFGLGSID
jgi:hypothetical protein